MLWIIYLILVTTSCRFHGFGDREAENGCEPPSLEIGETVYEIETIKVNTDGSLNIPNNLPDKAYWVEGTDLQYIFLLSPTDENLSLIRDISAGTLAKATWSNCNSMTFSLSAPQPGSFGTTYLPDQSSASIAIYIQSKQEGDGLVVMGEVAGGEINTFNTPDPDNTEVQAEISLEETRVSSDGNKVQVMVSINNFGERDITISAQDVVLLPAGASQVTMTSSEPALPREIATAATESFLFTFPHPETSTAILRVFTVEYEIDF